MSRELLKRISEFAQKYYPIRMNGLIAEIEVELKKPDPEPDYWHVVDEDGNSIYSASFKEACHDHIKEAQLSDDIYFAVDVASKWVVRPLWSKPQIKPEPLSDGEIMDCKTKSLDDHSYEDVDWGWTTKKVLNELKFARAIEQKVRGEK